MRYIRNQTKTDCSPTAILNALKWSGYHITYKKDNKWIKRLLKYNKYSSGTPSSFTESYISNNPNFKKVSSKLNPSVNDINKALRRGNAVIVGIKIHENRGHIFFIDKKIGNKFNAINFGRCFPTECLIDSKVLKKSLKTVKWKFDTTICYSYPKMWEIGRL